MIPSRERAVSAKTLVCFLQSLVGHKVTIELKNDLQINGIVKSVDAFMNTELTQVNILKPIDLTISEYDQLIADYFFVNGPKIRYVYVPDDVNVIENIEKQINIIQSFSRARLDNSKNNLSLAEIK